MTIINSSHASIDTVAPALNIGEIQLSADRRASKGQTLTDAERIRRVVLPANVWGNLAATIDGVPSMGLTEVLRKALQEIGSARLRDTLTEDPMLRSVPLKDYSVSALLAWNADTAASRGSITFTRDDVEAWYPTSFLYKRMTEKGAQWAEFVGKRLATLAAKNHGLKKPEEADKLVALLEDDAIADNSAPVVAELVQRLVHISKALAAKTADTAISLDDL